MKFGKMLLVALLCGLFLLLLSALVVAPETETVLQENLPLTGLEMSACALPVWADAGDSASRWFWMLAALFFCAPLCLLPLSGFEPGLQRLRAAPGPLSG